MFSYLPKFSLNPNSVHDFLIFSVLDYSVKVFALDCLKSNLFKKLLDLFNCEVVCTRFIDSYIEILLNF